MDSSHKKEQHSTIHYSHSIKRKELVIAPRLQVLQTPPQDLHAHFDCFSGAAGDMILAACLDVPSNSPELLKRIKWNFKLGIPDVRDKYQTKGKKVWNGGRGNIAGLKVDVECGYEHAPVPFPKYQRHD